MSTHESKMAGTWVLTVAASSGKTNCVSHLLEIELIQEMSRYMNNYVF